MKVGRGFSGGTLAEDERSRHGLRLPQLLDLRARRLQFRRGQEKLLAQFLTLRRRQLRVGKAQQPLDFVSQVTCLRALRVRRHRDPEAPERTRVVPAEHHLESSAVAAGAAVHEHGFVRFAQAPAQLQPVCGSPSVAVAALAGFLPEVILRIAFRGPGEFHRRPSALTWNSPRKKSPFGLRSSHAGAVRPAGARRAALQGGWR